MCAVRVLGVGAGSTSVLHGECSSSFMLEADGKPVLMIDAGFGSVHAALQHYKALANIIYISHNHSDHSGELPVLLATQHKAGRRPTVLAEEHVMQLLTAHRLHELQSTGQHLQAFADFVPLAADRAFQLPATEACSGLSIALHQARHAERCFGFVLSCNGQPLLGWSGDSGSDTGLYSFLSAAPVVLVDARRGASSEHAGFAEVAAAASPDGALAACCTFIYGYGRLDEAPQPGEFPALEVARPGDLLQLPMPAAAMAVASQAEANGAVQSESVAESTHVNRALAHV